MTLTFDLKPDLDVEFSRSDFETAISQEWERQLTWKEMDVSR